MNMITAMIIQSRGDDIVCSAGGPTKDNGKWVGWITLYRDGEYDHELLSSQPVFDTKKDAVEYMKGVVKSVREMDLELSPEIKEAVNIAQQIKNAI